MQTPFQALDTTRAAEYLGLSSSTLAKLRLTGTGLAYSKLGRRVVYSVRDLDAWISANRFLSTSEYLEKQR